MLTVAVLGPVEVHRDETRLAVPAGKTAEVLIRLALDAGVQVRTERLIEDLWSDQAVRVAPNTLQSKISQLRRALGDAQLVLGGSSGYTLKVLPTQVDALEVARLAQDAAASRERGDPTSAISLCTAGLALFRGELIPDGGDAEWLAPHRSRLEEVRLRLIEDRLAARVDLGAGAEVIAELESLVAESPLREELWRLLVTALYRAGRQADALEAYRRIRTRLADDLGVDPGPALRALEQRILVQDRRLQGFLGNLPSLTGSLVGRAASVHAVGRLLDGDRLVTIVGPAGVGKTRLAIEVAGRRSAWLVRLEGTPSGEPHLWPVVGEAFGLSGASSARVVDRLRGVEALLVLDNCEHVVDSLGPLVGSLLDSLPGVQVLATSQRPLGLDGETVYPLEPLSLADSVVLFRERALAQRRSFSLPDETAYEICRSLDGLPLAIELAAARAKALSADEIARRIDDRFSLLSDPTSNRPWRRRTLRSAIGWSYDLLFPDDQRGLWALGCFADDASLAAVEHVLAALGVPAGAAVDVVDRLVDRSLVVVSGSPVRYRLLDSVRAFSREQLETAGQSDTAYGAFASWYDAAAARAADGLRGRESAHAGLRGRESAHAGLRGRESAPAGLRGREQAQHLAFVRAERANIDAALAWTAIHDPALGLQIANGFGWAWIMLGAGADAARRARAALTAAGAPDVDGLLFTGWFEAAGGHLDQALADVNEAIANADDDALRARGHLFLSFVNTQGGRPAAALAALDGHREALVGWEAGAAWLLTAWAEIALGNLGAAQEACTEAARLLGPRGDAWILSHAEAILGGLAQSQHRFPAAISHLRQAVDAAHELGFTAAEALHLANLGRAYQQNSDLPTALAVLEQAVETAQAAGDLRTVALATTRQGRVLRALSRPEAARVEVAKARQWFQTAGGGDGALLAEHLAAALDGDEPSLRTVLEEAHATGDQEIELLTLDSLALVHAERSDAAIARELLAAADALYPAVAHLVTADDRAAANWARSQLG